ncbi:MAG: ABC transporter permease [Chloroflexi bacterium]|nr:ABC transporter permease [Chloroflexota bacterium]
MRNGRKFDPIGFGLNGYLILVGLFLMAPMFFIVVNSFNESAFGLFPPQAWSLRWYENALFHVPQFWDGLKNSLVSALGAMILAVLMSTLVSRALSHYLFKGKEALRSFFFSPLLVPRIVFGCAVFLLYIRIGLYGTIPGLILAHSLLGVPFGISIISATWLSIDPSTEEAAQDLGATPVQAFFRVVLPQLRIALIVSGLFAFLESFDQVDVSLFITRPANNTLPIEMFNYSANYQDPTLAAVSTMLILFSAFLVMAIIPLLKTQEARRLLERRQ